MEMFRRAYTNRCYVSAYNQYAKNDKYITSIKLSHVEAVSLPLRIDVVDKEGRRNRLCQTASDNLSASYLTQSILL